MAKYTGALTDKQKEMLEPLEKEVKEGNKEESEKELNVTLKNIDKALNAGLIKKNNAARKKSRLTKSVNSME